jgi:hypothetical protein
MSSLNLFNNKCMSYPGTFKMRCFLTIHLLKRTGDQEGLFKLAVQLRIFLIRLFITLQLDMFCWFI